MKNKLYLFVFLLQVLALSVHAAVSTRAACTLKASTCRYCVCKKSFDEQGGKGGLYSSG